MNLDEYYMELALKEARKAFKHQEVPVGVIILHDGKIIARGANKRQIRGNVTDHAELIAIRKASKKIKDWRLDNCTMYVTLFPCPMCASAIVQSRIKNLIIGTISYDSKNMDISNLILNNSNLNIKTNILENKCSEILTMFFQNRRINNKLK